MVCVGFSNMFGDLLDKLGIENSELSVSVDISYDAATIGREEILKEKSVESSGHARRYVHIVDEKYINNLLQKYDYINNYSGWPEKFNDLIYDLGNYIVSHVNKSITGDTIMKAVEEVYRKTSNYSEEELQHKLFDIRQKNKERQEKFFPTRYIEYEDGRKEIYDNETNKFDIEDIPNKVM